VTVLRIDEAGPATSVQDIGRFGAQRYGLGTAGALDRFSLAVANCLVGQSPTAAAVEIGPFPARLTATNGPAGLALAGAERDVTAGGRQLGVGRGILLADGETLSIRASRSGVFTYLAVAGGIRGNPVFGSLSVHARAGLGSPFPRPLRAGDELELNSAIAELPMRTLPARRADTGPIRVVLGPQDDYFTAETIRQFLDSEWRISPTSDRMGYRLDGPRLTHAKGHNIVSDGIANGHIQIPGNGQPLVLLADRGTTGGYPKIACIATVDLGRFAQSPVGSAVRFRAVSIEDAQTEARCFVDAIKALRDEMRTDWSDFSSEALLLANLAGDAVDANDWPLG
jgi:biotin-dependent carboxylase-like uncharacterized protein